MPDHRSERIAAGEAAAVCAHYDLGVVHSVHRLRRGSGHSPKIVLRTSTGLYLLKRRAAAGHAGGRTDPTRVALSHAAQIHLAQAGVPVPRLIGTRADNNSMVQVGDRVYEVFEFVPGEAYDRSMEATTAAGGALGQYHRAMASFRSPWDVGAITYHGLRGPPSLADRLERASTERGGGRAGRAAARELGTLYDHAADHADRLAGGSIAAWPSQVIHGDWHAGNLVFRRRTVVAIIDHDSIGRGPRVLDVANGALQFSMVRPGDPAAAAAPGGGGSAPGPVADNWPAQVDEPRFTAFCGGYHAQSGIRLGTAEVCALPWLMVEALITEAVSALRGMGRSHLLDPAGLLRMVLAKSAWLASNADRLARLV